MMFKLFLKIYNTLISRKVLTVLSAAMIFSLCILGASKLRYGEDIADFLPDNEKYSRVSEFVAQAAGNSEIFIYFSNVDTCILNTERLSECMTEFTKILKNSKESLLFKNFESKTDNAKIVGLLTFVEGNIPFYLSEDDYKNIESLINDDHFKSALENDKTILSSPAPAIIKKAVQLDPAGLFTNTLKNLQNLKPSENYTFKDGFVFQEKQKRGILFFKTDGKQTESGKNSVILDDMQQAADKLAKNYSDIKIDFSGAPVVAVCNAQRIKRDSILTGILSLIIIAIILILSVKNLQNIIIIGVTLLFSFIAAACAAWIVFDKISLIAIGISAVFTGIAVNYPLHFINHLSHTRSIRQNLEELVSPLITGNITTVAAFYSLMFADSPALKQLGFTGGTLLAAAIFFTLIYVPQFVKIPALKSNQEDKSKISENIFNFFSGKTFAKIALIITPLLMWSGMYTKFDTDMHKINYMTDFLKKDMGELSGNGDSLTSVFITSHGNDFDGAMKNFELTTQISNNLKSKGLIKSISGPDNYLPSNEMQSKKIKLWNAFIEKNGEKILNLLNKYEASAGFSPNAFIKFKSMINNRFDEKTFEYFKPVYNAGLENYISNKNNRWVVTAVAKVKNENLDKVTQSFKNCPQEIFVFGEKIISQSLAQSLNNNFNFVLYAAGILVFIFLTFSLADIELGIITFIPLTVGWLWILGIMNIFSINFNIVNIILATFIFGQGDDYAVFITEGLMYEYAKGKKVLGSFKKSVGISSLIMFAGIGSLVFAVHPAMSSLGTTVIIGMFSVVICAYVFPPMIFEFITRKNGKIKPVPHTLQRLTYSIYSVIVFLLCCFRLSIAGLFIKIFGRNNDNFKMKFHELMCKTGNVVKMIPGVTFEQRNPYNETFEKPCVIIANHQSFIDTMCIIRLSTKTVILTNDRQQKNPFYGKVMRISDFFPVSDGYDLLVEKLDHMVKKGYNIAVFPEGTRSEDCKINRFHQGAFNMAKHFNLDIVPVFIHGAGHVLPKKDFMLRKGKITVTIGKRITHENELWADTILETTRHFRHFYIKKYNEISRNIEDYNYVKPYVQYNYCYKGAEVKREVNRQLKTDCKFIDNYQSDLPVLIKNCGYGAISLAFALVNKQAQVYAEESDNEKFLTASNSSIIPSNLHYIKNHELIKNIKFNLEIDLLSN